MCAAYRVPHSQFLSWPCSDRDKATWQYLREKQKCPQCGTRADEWDPDAGGHRRAYRARIVDCEGCIVVERTADAPEMKQGRGKKIVLIKNKG